MCAWPRTLTLVLVPLAAGALLTAALVALPGARAGTADSGGPAPARVLAAAPKAPAKAPAKDDTPKPLTDDDVSRALEKGREYLINLANADGSFGKGDSHPAGASALAFMTLAYMGEHPNREVMTRGLNYLMNINTDTGFSRRQGYAVPIRIMGLSYIHNKILSDKRALLRAKMTEDILRLQMGQQKDHGWRYELRPTESYDFSVTQWPILAMREASLVGVEFPEDPLRKARELYYKHQRKDGGWCYEGSSAESRGSMTAAGLASLFIISDVLEPASGCPCKSGQSQGKTTETERRIDAALEWLSKNFDATRNPGGGGTTLYWLYCVERVGIAAGYKYFGKHHWYREGAEAVVRKQNANGSWGGLPDTCFALLFLYKGRAPVLFNKLKFEGEWNNHRRDIANLTHFIERTKEQQFHWQIVELNAPLEELHDAPILYITAETVPNWSDADKKKLRAFTDSGGTILFEASCGNPAVRKWFVDFAREVWPEWKLAKLAPDHEVWKAEGDIREKPEFLGLDDGLRTFLFYAPDDISCAWQMRALASREYLFKWGINLYTYATDKAPLRAKLAGRAADKAPRFRDPVKAGPRTTLRLARVRHGGNWEVGANYGGLRELARQLQARAGLTLQVAEPSRPPVTEGGVAPADLAAHDVAFLTGTGDLVLKPDDREALKAFTAKGGFLWVEAAGGSLAFDKAFHQAAAEMKWDLRLLGGDHPLMNGRMDPAVGYNLTTGLEFRQALRVARLGRPQAEFFGIYEGDRLVGVYSALDIVYGLTACEAFKCRGYKTPDALAVATNLALYLSTLK